jgi:hypothetical protein
MENDVSVVAMVLAIDCIKGFMKGCQARPEQLRVR